MPELTATLAGTTTCPATLGLLSALKRPSVHLSALKRPSVHLSALKRPSVHLMDSLIANGARLLNLTVD